MRLALAAHPPALPRVHTRVRRHHRAAGGQRRLQRLREHRGRWYVFVTIFRTDDSYCSSPSLTLG